ncbi:WD domain-containing protein 8 [Elsinoe fawcettii]|nr:WD domain-containing protein 8 [Elsinoe fawcettii]
MHWMESMSWLGWSSNIVTQINALMSILKDQSSASQLRVLLGYAQRFIVCHEATVDLAPLQIYEIARVFGPRRSVTNNSVEEEIRASFNLTSKAYEGAYERGRLAYCPSKRQRNWIQSLCFSPSGDDVASVAYQAKAVQIWDVSTAEVRLNLIGHSSWIRCLIYSDDGKRLASASNDKTIRLWDAKIGVMIFILTGHEDWVLSVCFSSSGERIASTASDKTIRMWDAMTGEEIRRFDGHEAPVLCACFSSDGERIASVSDDQTVRIWALKDAAKTLTLTGHTYSTTSVCFSPNGDQIALVSSDNVVQIWAIDSGAVVSRRTNHHRLGPLLRSIFDQDAADSGFSVHLGWVERDGEKFLHLPREFQAAEIAIQNDVIAFGFRSGIVVYLTYDRGHH